MVHAVLTLAERIKKGDYQLPLGKGGTEFLDRALMGHKVLEAIIGKYKELLMADPNAVPLYYLKEGNKRHHLTDPFRVMETLELELTEFLKCGNFSISELTEMIARRRGLSKEEARASLLVLCHDFITETQNAPSLEKESPRRGRPKELIQGELV